MINQTTQDCVIPVFCDIVVFCAAVPAISELSRKQQFARASEVLVTRPVNDLPFQTNFVVNEFSCLIRTINQRILIERMIEAKDMTQLSCTFSSPPNNETLLSILATVLPQYQFEPDCSWHYLNYSTTGPSAGALRQLSKNAFFFAEDCQNGFCMNFLLAEEAFRKLFRLHAKL